MEVTGEHRPLSRKAATLVLLATILTSALVVAVAMAVWEQHRRTIEINRAQRVLQQLQQVFSYHTGGGRKAFSTSSRPSLTADTVRRFNLIRFGAMIGTPFVWQIPPETGVLIDDHYPGLDPWGHVLVYECPGPVHFRGWDLYSVGPNGIDEHGGGDDILVGEDVADVSSR
jgi:hypothetical protein